MALPLAPPLRCVIVDDEPLAHTVLRAYLDQLPGLVRWAGSCYDGPEALHHLLATPADVLFLDVDMPGLTGLELLRALPHAPAVVLTTAYETHALAAYELGVVDYLLKPILFERFVKTVGRLRAAAAPGPPPGPPAEGLRAGAVGAEGLFLKTDSGSERIRPADLLFLEGHGNFVKAHLLTGRPLLTSETLKHLEERLPAGHFLRIHKSFVINIAHIDRLSGNYVRVGGRELPLDNTYRQDVLRRLKLS
ncbi:LytR/AlgR family response regulator transcription factor [Hymenobacter arizonensis]|uniref:DNA-binding response regulator, LytR/AlgR family n=1 Tax=Hymenobacter arizonensis TaxID=1227077 RepID=A0A1I6BE49_HYMAR|nr:LytTR family DNA-binding domain-containing protein [Hymenobacter arizonensis]SFQ79181.1 DNA-binding response regulator, LytR/AlgR family [Hymenobacter arizonensis]